MRRRPFAAILVVAGLLLVACGGSSKAKTGAGAPLKELHDPKSAPTATLPAALPSPITAKNVSALAGGGSASQSDTVVVKSGDTLGAIASQHNVSPDELAKANGITDPTRIQVGQKLTIPRPGATPGPGSPTPTAGATAAPSPTVTPSPRAVAGSPVPPTGGAPTGAATPTTAPAASATPTPPPASRTPAAVATEYSVRSGDTACEIAKRYSVSLQELADANHVTKDQIARLTINQVLVIPSSTGHRDC
jgi:LysM repeat protein